MTGIPLKLQNGYKAAKFSNIKLPVYYHIKLTAKSTRCSLPARTRCLPSGPLSLHSIVIVKIA